MAERSSAALAPLVRRSPVVRPSARLVGLSVSKPPADGRCQTASFGRLSPPLDLRSSGKVVVCGLSVVSILSVADLLSVTVSVGVEEEWGLGSSVAGRRH